MYDVVLNVHRMLTTPTSSSSSSSSSMGGFSMSGYDDDEEDEMTASGLLPTYVEVPITTPNHEIKKLLLENTSLIRKRLSEIVSSAAFQVRNKEKNCFFFFLNISTFLRFTFHIYNLKIDCCFVCVLIFVHVLSLSCYTPSLSLFSVIL